MSKRVKRSAAAAAAAAPTLEAAASEAEPDPPFPLLSLPDEMPVDLSGTWRCCSVGESGSFDDFLKTNGVPWFIRKIAKFDGYGAGKEVEVITMASETQFKAVNNGPRGQITQEYAIDGTEQVVPNIPDGSPTKLTASWEGDVLVCIVRPEGKDLELRTSRSLNADGRLRLELRAAKRDGSKSATTDRVFERTEAPALSGWGNALRAQEVEANGETTETPRG